MKKVNLVWILREIMEDRNERREFEIEDKKRFIYWMVQISKFCKHNWENPKSND